MLASIWDLRGFWGTLLLLLDIWAIVSVVGSRASTAGKVLWVLLIVLLPFLGFVLWFFLGPRGMPRSA